MSESRHGLGNWLSTYRILLVQRTQPHNVGRVFDFPLNGRTQRALWPGKPLDLPQIPPLRGVVGDARKPCRIDKGLGQYDGMPVHRLPIRRHAADIEG